ncbi:MAG: MATE family efflux transporter [Myxococcota bacterium]
MQPPTDDDRGPVRGIEKETEELGDPDASPGIPSASLAAQARLVPSPSDLAPEQHDGYGEIWRLAWPVIASQMLAYAVNLIDIAMVGRLGRDALAAVGYATQVFFLVQSIFFAVSFACVALMARALGAGEPARARQALAASLLVASSVAILLSATALSLPREILGLLQAPPEIVERAVPYFRLVLGSSLLLAIAVVYESGLRAAKDTRTPMVIGGAVTLVKILLNAVLIFGAFGFPRLELAGAGIATVASQVVAVLLFLAVSRRPRIGEALALRSRDLVAARPLLADVVRISLPAIGERVVMNLAMMSYFAILGGYGSAAVAAYTVGVRVLAFSWIPGTGFSAAASTLVGQALGARAHAAATRAGWRAVRMGLATSIVLGIVCAVAREPLGRLFTPDEGVVAALGPFMLVLAIAQPFLGLHFTLAGALRGAGDTMTPLLAATLGNWGFRVPLAALCALVLHTDIVFVWGALFFDHVARTVWLTIVYQRGRWQTRLEPAS